MSCRRSRIIVPPGLEQRERVQMIARLAILTRRTSKCSQRRVARRWPIADRASPQRRQGTPPRAPSGRQFAAQVGRDPQARNRLPGVQVAGPREPARALWQRPPCLVSGEVSPARKQRVAIGDVQLSQPLSPRGLCLDLLCLCQFRQRLRRRPPFPGVGAKPSNAGARTPWASTASRSIDKAWRAPAPRASCACLCCLATPMAVGRLLLQAELAEFLLEQDFSARPVQFGFECAMARAIRSRQRLVEDGDRAAGIAARSSASASAIFRAPSKIKRAARAANSTPRRMSSSPPPTAPVSGRPTLKKHAERVKHGKVMLTGEPGYLKGVRRAAPCCGRASIRTSPRTFFQSRAR